ncbi:alanine racemase, partial [Klebsiella pneumoniae]|nr:alanine racemase [Klebsiella pneumoniae]
PAGLPLRCWAEIDLAALERNLRRIRASLPPHIRYVAVVKADAYGHGLHQVAARLMHAGADLFAVANLAEAAALREVGPDWPVLVLGAL